MTSAPTPAEPARAAVHRELVPDSLHPASRALARPPGAQLEFVPLDEHAGDHDRVRSDAPVRTETVRSGLDQLSRRVADPPAVGERGSI